MELFCEQLGGRTDIASWSKKVPEVKNKNNDNKIPENKIKQITKKAQVYSQIWPDLGTRSKS